MTQEEKIQAIIDTDIQPYIKMHAGEIEFINVQDNIVHVKLKGACVGCPMSMFTLKAGVERLLKQQMPEIKEVIAL